MKLAQYGMHSELHHIHSKASWYQFQNYLSLKSRLLAFYTEVGQLSLLHTEIRQAILMWTGNHCKAGEKASGD